MKPHRTTNQSVGSKGRFLLTVSFDQNTTSSTATAPNTGSIRYCCIKCQGISEPASVALPRLSPPLREVGNTQPYCCAPPADAVAFPIASPDSTSSTRRFCCRPSAVSLEAIG